MQPYGDRFDDVPHPALRLALRLLSLNLGIGLLHTLCSIVNIFLGFDFVHTIHILRYGKSNDKHFCDDVLLFAIFVQ